MFGGNAVILLLFLANAVVRGAGDATIAMRGTRHRQRLESHPCALLRVRPRFFPAARGDRRGLRDDAARGLGAAYTLAQLFRGKSRVKVESRHLVLHPEVMLRMVKLSASGMFQVFIGTASWIGMVRIVSLFGSDAVAGYTIGMRVMLFALFPAFGLANAAATMVGQSLGARQAGVRRKGRVAGRVV